MPTEFPKWAEVPPSWIATKVMEVAIDHGEAFVLVRGRSLRLGKASDFSTEQRDNECLRIEHHVLRPDVLKRLLAEFINSLSD